MPEYIGQYSRDKDKKRKKWVDCKLEIDENRNIRIVEDQRLVQRVLVDAKLLEALHDGEDVTVGHVMLRIEVDAQAEMMSSSNKTLMSSSSTILNTTGTAPPNKRPRIFQPLHPNLSNIKIHVDGSHQSTEEPQLLVKSKSGTVNQFTEYFTTFSGKVRSVRLAVRKDKFLSPIEYASHFIDVMKEQFYRGMFQSLVEVERFCLAKQGVRIKYSEHVRSLGHIRLPDAEVIISNEDGESISSSYEMDDDSTHQHRTSIFTANTRIFLKVTKQCRDNWTEDEREGMNKGDIWLLWAQDFSQSDIDNQEQASLVGAYRNAKASGYELPCFKGFLWRDVWVVRSQWSSFSSEGLLQITDIYGTSIVPSSIGKLSSGKVKGVLKQHVTGLRLTNEQFTLASMDILYQGLERHAKKVTQDSSAFGSLLESNAFTSMLNAPDAASSQQYNAVASKHNPFIALSYIEVQRAVDFVSSQFRLNSDQTAVITRVGQWFCPLSTTTSTSDDIILVHGIFGSGKSHLLCAVVQLLAILSNCTVKCLIGANTNVAVDRILTQLLELEGSSTWNEAVHEAFPSIPSSLGKLVRIGCAARVDRAMRKHLVSQAETVLAAKRDLLLAAKRDSDPLLKALLDECERKEYLGNQRKKIDEATVIGATCASTLSSLLKDMRFHVMILDEASQVTEPISLLPLACSKARKMIVVGDPKQLPPIGSDNKGSSISTITLFDRLVAIGWPCVDLRTQYRCHPVIANICNKLFYGDKILHGVSATDRPALVGRLSPVSTLLIENGTEERRGNSWIHRREIEMLSHLVSALATQSTKPGLTIGVVCFYRAQLQLAQSALISYTDTSHDTSETERPSVHIATVDAFQGHESDVIVLLTTRSEETSFLSEEHRVNVAISRAKHHLIILSTQALLDSSALWQSISRSGVSSKLIDGIL